MECVRLRVQTVPAFDPETHEKHTAYLVLRDDSDGGLVFNAPGWTLKDAIDIFCRRFKIERGQIRILRPFLPQRMDWYDNK